MTIPLRQRLFLLMTAGILPIALMGGVGLYLLAQQQPAQARSVGLELARSVANAVDAELQRSTAVLEVLATTPTLDRDDLNAFRIRAARVIAAQPYWAAIVLLGPDGRPMVDTRVAPDLAIQAIERMTAFDRVLRTHAPAVGVLTRHDQGDWHFPILAPVLRGGTVRYVVAALVRPEAIRSVLTRQHVPTDWVISIVDANGLRVARSRAHDENLGGRLSETVQRVVDTSPEDFGVAYTLEGERIFTPFGHVGSTGWLAVLGIPTALVDAATYRSLAVYAGGILLSLVLGTLAAVWATRSIARPIAELRAAAEELGRHGTPVPPETSIREIHEVGAALRSAAEELARGEEEREALLENERRAREAAESADRAKDEFMAVLSHELRTPLNAVYGWARLLKGGLVPDDALIERAQDAIVRNADVQVRLIDDLLDLSRISSGKMRLDIRLLDVSQVLQGALDAVRPAADARQIRITTQVDPGIAPVAADASRMQQVIWNLLVNAVKFTPPGGMVEVHLQATPSHVKIVISDTGQGIDPDMLSKVFERFRQADSSSTRAHGGLGLGLALVKQLVELHGGTVSAASAGLGKGATFTVTLPATSSAQVAAGTRVAPRELDLSRVARLDGLRILVVDDDPDSLYLAEAILTSAGAECRTSRSATDALQRLEEWQPHMLVSDIEMPERDGYWLIRQVRSVSGCLRDVPAIALSAYGRTGDRLRSISAGFNMHVPKPVDPGELTGIIASTMEQIRRPPA